ncbi:MAG: hypothetical protein WCX97_03090 [Candidatus Magasanikbacteria bacterium]
MYEIIFIGGLCLATVATTWFFWCHYGQFETLLRVPCGKYEIVHNDDCSPWVIIAGLKKNGKRKRLSAIELYRGTLAFEIKIGTIFKVEGWGWKKTATQC